MPLCAQAALLADGDVLIHLAGPPRQLRLAVPPAAAGGRRASITVELHCVDAALQAIVHLSEKRVDSVRAALFEASSAAPGGLATARAVPLLLVLRHLAEGHQEQLRANRQLLETVFDHADSDDDGAITPSQLALLLRQRDAALDDATVALLAHRVQQASEAIEPAAGDLLLKQAFVHAMLRGAPGFVPAVLLRADLVHIGHSAPALPPGRRATLQPRQRAARSLLVRSKSSPQLDVAIALESQPPSPDLRRSGATECRR